MGGGREREGKKGERGREFEREKLETKKEKKEKNFFFFSFSYLTSLVVVNAVDPLLVALEGVVGRGLAQGPDLDRPGDGEKGNSFDFFF